MYVLFCQHRYVHCRIMPVIVYQESKAGNSSHHLKRMGEFLQCYVKTLAFSKQNIAVEILFIISPQRYLYNIFIVFLYMASIISALLQTSGPMSPQQSHLHPARFFQLPEGSYRLHLPLPQTAGCGHRSAHNCR